MVAGKKSSYCVFRIFHSKIPLVQPLSGQVALLGEAEARALRGLAAGAALPSTLDEAALRQARFLVDSDDEDRALKAEAWAGWLEEVERTPTQLVLVPTFGCNLRCAYCYQEVFDPSGRGLVAPEVLDAFFAYVEARHGSDSPRPYLTLFGGEPLVDTSAHRDRLRRVLDGARAARLTVAAVTNGYDLEAFADELHAGPVKEVQVTLDGPREVHDARRPHGTGRGTFDHLPPVENPLYHYAAINVDAQQRSPASLWNWMRRVIGIRTRFPLFGRGRFEMLEPLNHRVFAYLREDARDTILCVANLSRYSQPCELDLRRYAGWMPVELFGDTPFPLIGELPYFLTLGPHSFYWFRLRPPGEQESPAGESPRRR